MAQIPGCHILLFVAVFSLTSASRIHLWDYDSCATSSPTVAARAWLMNVVYLTSVSSENRKDRILLFSPASVQVHVEEREKGHSGLFADL